jgi:hypothetical protein
MNPVLNHRDHHLQAEDLARAGLAQLKSRAEISLLNETRRRNFGSLFHHMAAKISHSP